MPRYLYKKGHRFEGKTRYDCDFCPKKDTGGGFIFKQTNKPAVICCSNKCRGYYEDNKK